MRCFFITMMFIGLMGCATTYENGTESQQITENIHRISMRGNEFTDENHADDYALLKAAEATIDSGRRYFTITDKLDKTEISTHVIVPEKTTTTTQSSTVTKTSANASFLGVVLPEKLTARANGQYDGNTDTDSSSTTTTTSMAAQTYTSVSPGVDMMIKTYNAKPDGKHYDALDIVKYLGPMVNPDRWGEETKAN